MHQNSILIRFYEDAFSCKTCQNVIFLHEWVTHDQEMLGLNFELNWSSYEASKWRNCLKLTLEGKNSFFHLFCHLFLKINSYMSSTMHEDWAYVVRFAFTLIQDDNVFSSFLGDLDVKTKLWLLLMLRGSWLHFEMNWCVKRTLMWMKMCFQT